MENKPKLSHEIIAASSGALITSLFVTPLDVVKTRLQVQQKNLLSKRCFLYHNGLMDHLFYCLNGNGNGNGNNNKIGNNFQRPPLHWIYRPNHFNGTRDAFVKIVRNEGFTSLWSGLSPTLVLAIPTTVLYFLSYEKLKNKLYKLNQNSSMTINTDQKSHSFWIPVVAGSSARFIAATLVSPLELIRTKMLSTKLSYFQIGQALKGLIKSNGLLGLWKGLTPTLLRDVPFSAMYWSSFEYLKSFNKSKNLTSTESFAQNFFAGAISGFVAATVTLPFDVVKTHQQIELGENVYKLASANNAIEKPANTISIISKIYRQNGIKGLFAGYVPRVTKVAPACAIMISVFEYGKHMLNSKLIVAEVSEDEKGTENHHQQSLNQHNLSRNQSSMSKKSVVILDTL